MKDLKILFIGAMDSEIKDFLLYYDCQFVDKLGDKYPYYLSHKKSSYEIAVLRTFVGDTNAALATALALEKYKPNYVFKIGCVGGNSQSIHTNDLLLPLGFFHSGSWITRSKVDNTPTANASLWQSVFGDKPYQVNDENLGYTPYFLKPDNFLVKKFRQFFTKTSFPPKPCYIGGGNTWFFDHEFMENVPLSQIPGYKPGQSWGADMESYSIIQACSLFKVPFMGFYRVSNSDYYNEPYIPKNVANLFDSTFIKQIDKFLDTI